MDEQAERYREHGIKIRAIAESTSDQTTRDSLLTILAEYERMAAALDKVAPADCAHPKHPSL